MPKVEKLRPAEAFFPPSILFSPRIMEGGTVNLRPDPEYGLGVLMNKWDWSKTEIDSRLAERRLKGDFFPDNLQAWYDNELTRFNEIATRYKISAHNIESSDYTSRKQWTRDLIFELFPQIQRVVKNGHEHEVFKGKSVEEYVDQDALPYAFGFVDWLTDEDKLPTSKSTTLKFFSPLSLPTSIFELVRAYKGNAIHFAPYPIPSSDSKRNIIFKYQYNHEILTILYLTYIATIADITKHPKEEDIRKAFIRDISDAYQNIKIANLMVKMFNRQPVKINVMDGSTLTDSYNQKRKKKKKSLDYDVGQTYQLRQFDNSHDSYVLFEEREKEQFPRMLRLIRGRFPLPDALGVRFVLINKEHLSSFTKKTIKRLKNWDFEREGGQTSPEESSEGWQGAEKYTIRWKNCPTLPIEMQIHWLKEGQIRIGPYALRVLGERENHYRFRLEQLLNHVYPFVYPTHFYGIDWRSKFEKKQLYDYAYRQTLQAALIPPIE